MSLLKEPKIDTHCHLLDPVRFSYAQGVKYQPLGQEAGDVETFKAVMGIHGVMHALLVGPNSGYNYDNSCMLDAIARDKNRFKGVAVVSNNCSHEPLIELKKRGVVGVAFNVALNGSAHYADIAPLLGRLEALDMWAQFQVEGDQLIELMPLIKNTNVKILFDHGGRPVLSSGLGQKGFQALLALGRDRRAVVKLSGEVKYSEQRYPFVDARPFTDALINAFGLSNCLWASDWPYIKAPFRIEYGPMLLRWESSFSKDERRQIMWTNPKKMFGFA